jgi:hypothetical protein
MLYRFDCVSDYSLAYVAERVGAVVVQILWWHARHSRQRIRTNLLSHCGVFQHYFKKFATI